MAPCCAMICHQVTLSGDAEWPKVADPVIEADFYVLSWTVPRTPAWYLVETAQRKSQQRCCILCPLHYKSGNPSKLCHHVLYSGGEFARLYAVNRSQTRNHATKTRKRPRVCYTLTLDIWGLRSVTYSRLHLTPGTNSRSEPLHPMAQSTGHTLCSSRA